MGYYLKQEKGFYKHLFLLTLPVVLQNLVTTSLGLVDTFMVGMVGDIEMAAVTAANTPIFVLQCIIFGMQSGLGILVSQYWGHRDMENIRRSTNVAFLMVFLLTLLTSAAALLFPEQIMLLVTDNLQLVPVGAGYLRIVACSYLFNGFSMVYLAAQRSMENPKLGMYVLIVSMLLNTVLNYVMIFGKLGLPAMGVLGAAWATFASRVVECLILLTHSLRTKVIPPIAKLLLHPDKAIMKAFMKYSAPVILNELLWVVGFSMSTVIMGHMDNSKEMLAASAIAKNIHNLTTVACFGLANSIAVVLGKQIGQQRSREEVYRTGVGLMITAVLLGVAVGGFLLILTPLFFKPILFPLFKLSSEELHIALVLSVSNFIAMPIYSFANALVVGVLRSGGDVKAATLIDMVPQWVLTVPLTALTALVLKTNVIWIAAAIQSEALLKVPLGIWRLRQGKWVRDITTEVQ